MFGYLLATLANIQLCTFGVLLNVQRSKLSHSAQKDILQLPHVAVVNPQINSILSTYLETFEVIHSSPPIETHDDEKAFLRIVQDQLARSLE